MKIQLVQKYNNQILAKVERMEQIREEISIAVGSKEKDLSVDIDNLIDSAMEDQKKSKYILDDLNNKVTLKKKADPVNDYLNRTKRTLKQGSSTTCMECL